MLIFLFVSVALSSTYASEKSVSFSSHCFKRESIGERLVGYDVTRIVEQNTIKGCEDECNVYKCTHFSFGTVGNGTCELTTGREISRRQDPDFDVYERTEECAQGKPTGYEKACYRRLIIGKRLHERFIRHSLPCNSLEACQHQCSIEKHFHCQGFNIRLDPARVGRGICELSSISIRFLDESRDFVFDPEFLYYERDHGNESPNCGHVNRLSGGVPQQNSEGDGGQRDDIAKGGPYYGGDSYGPWSTGYGTIDHGPWGTHGYGSGLYESNNPRRGPAPRSRPVQPSNIYSHVGNKPVYGFDSKTFYGRDISRPPWLTPEIPNPPGKQDKNRSWRIPTYIIIDADANERDYGNPHRGTRPYVPQRPEISEIRPPWIPFHKTIAPFPPPKSPEPPGNFHIIGAEICFRREHAGFKLEPSTIRGMFDTPTVLDCEAMCTKSHFECTGYSYRYASSNTGAPNCLLTDYASLNQEVHLLPDRSCDVYFKMEACVGPERFGEAECFLKIADTRKIDGDKIAFKAFVGSLSECELECLNAKFFTCRSFSFRHGPGIIGEFMENCFLSDWPTSALKIPDLLFAPNYEIYERGSFGRGCELFSDQPNTGPRPTYQATSNIPQLTGHWAADETWKHFTVNGWPCRTGTQCRLNSEAGFWGCEVEGGDRGQWDYCCRPKHFCGFSKGYKYPWCYVGEAGPEQWRPCSEFYFPEFHNRYSYKPVHSHKPDPADSFGPPTETRPWNFGQEDFGPPISWPISYLHSDFPPNETAIWNHEESYVLSNQEDHVQHVHDDQPLIKFKPCAHKTPYPRAIVQKLDLKVTPSVKGPGEQLRKDESPKQPKKKESPPKVFDSSTTPRLFQKENGEKNNADHFLSTMPALDNLAGDAASEEDSGKTYDPNLQQNHSSTTQHATANEERISRAGKDAAKEKPEASENLTKTEIIDLNFVTSDPSLGF